MTLKQKTGFFNQKNGYKFEIKVLNIMRKDKGVIAYCRSSGSNGLADVWVLKDTGQLRVAACRNNGYYTKEERRKLAEFFIRKPKFTQLEFWFYRSPKKMKKVVIKSVDRILNWGGRNKE